MLAYRPVSRRIAQFAARSSTQAMKKLIIGCGYVGCRLAARWRDSGHQVFATTRSPIRADQFAQKGWKPVLCDITQPAGIELPELDVAVIAVGFDRSAGPSMREVYVDGLENVLKGLSPEARCIYVSSTSVYGQATGEMVDENSETLPQESSGQIVLEAERVLRAIRPQATILRFAGIYGPGRLLREQALREGKPIVASPDRWLNLIQVEDGVSAIERAEARGEPGRIFNVADDQPVKRIDFFSRLAELLGASPPRFEPPSSGALPPHEQTHRRISNRRMRSELGVQLAYPSYREGLLASVSSWPA